MSFKEITDYKSFITENFEELKKSYVNEHYDGFLVFCYDEFKRSNGE